MKRVLFSCCLLFAAFGQTRSRLAEYALVLEDAPVARKVQSRDGPSECDSAERKRGRSALRKPA